jgi:hypothetical protein
MIQTLTHITQCSGHYIKQTQASNTQHAPAPYVTVAPTSQKHLPQANMMIGSQQQMSAPIETLRAAIHRTKNKPTNQQKFK